MGLIRRSLPAAADELRLDRVVAASVSEWMSCHSLTLAATPEMKRRSMTAVVGQVADLAH